MLKAGNAEKLISRRKFQNPSVVRGTSVTVKPTGSVTITVNTSQLPISPQRSRKQAAESQDSRCLIGFLAFAVLLVLTFVHPLIALATCAVQTDLHSRIVLIPLISTYLIYIRWKHLPADY